MTCLLLVRLLRLIGSGHPMRESGHAATVEHWGLPLCHVSEGQPHDTDTRRIPRRLLEPRGIGHLG